MQLRNSKLYERLCLLEKKENVHIHDAGVPTKIVRRALGGESKGYTYENVGMSRGEQFSINCPFCSDEKHRCYIHHLFATPEDDYTHGYMRLWRCFNEECQSDYDNRMEMLKMITENDSSTVFQIDKRVNVKPQIEKPSWPGVMRTMATLAENEPDHIAIRWCLARNLDINRLIAAGVRYCETGKTKYPYASGRLVFPFIKRDPTTKKAVLAGWTARIVKKRNEMDPKWVHSRTPTRKRVVGLNGAVNSPISMWVEGPFDWIAAGRCSGAVLGKIISRDKASVIARALQKRPIKHRVSVILMDPDISSDAKKRGDLHHIEKSAAELRKVIDEPVVPVYLPPGTDPGSLYTGYIHDTVVRTVYDAGYKKAAELFDERRTDYSG